MTTSSDDGIIVGDVREANNTDYLQLMLEGLDRAESQALNYTDMFGLVKYLYGVSPYNYADANWTNRFAHVAEDSTGLSNFRHYSKINFIEHFKAITPENKTHYTVGNFIFTFNNFEKIVAQKVSANNYKPYWADQVALASGAALGFFILIVVPIF